jgi:hypothetical protein
MIIIVNFFEINITYFLLLTDKFSAEKYIEVLSDEQSGLVSCFEEFL